MASNNLGLPMPFFFMIYRVVADDFLTGFTMMTRSLTGLHVLFRMGGGVASDVGSADVADGDFHRAIDGNALGPGFLVDYPDALCFFHPDLLRLGWSGDI